MDWIKKFYEKTLLAGALLLLIVVAGYLAMKISKLSEEIHQSLSVASPTTRRVAAIETAPYSNAIAALQSPMLWTNGSPASLFPPVLVAPTLTTNNITPVSVETQAVVRLTAVIRRPFSMRFMSYRVDPNAKDGATDFQINFLTWDRTVFVKNVDQEIADRDIKTGYRITKFELKLVEEINPSVGGKITRDHSILTVQHEGEVPIHLIHGRVAHHPRLYARLSCPDKTNPIELNIGDTFESGGTTYKIVDIRDKEVLLLNTKSGEKQTLITSTP